MPDRLFSAVSELCPRDDRAAGRRAFEGRQRGPAPGGDHPGLHGGRRPCVRPHDVRHRRATLLHLDRVPAARASAQLGHSAQAHLRTYAHAVLDRTEIDYVKQTEVLA
ncbi:MAG: hypothetical protein ABI717_08165 [Actinomycetota bacterium]